MTLTGQKRLRTLPAIRRARGYYLYDSGSRRFLDLYQDGGRAWLGHRPEGLSLQLKNTLSRGVYAPYPGSEEGKLLKAAAALAEKAGAPGKINIRCYSSQSGVEGIPAAVDPLYSESGFCMFWRPGLPWPSDGEMTEILVPLPGLEYGRLIVSEKDDLPEGDLPSPVIAAAVTRCLWTLIHCLEKGLYPAAFEAEGFVRKGPYLLFQGSDEKYDILFNEALKAGILLPPDTGSPLILPCEMSPGDSDLLAKFFGTAGGPHTGV